jgi:hypothetical protein
MNIRKAVTGGLVAITAGATLALGAMAAGLGDYVVPSDNSLTSPIIVVGTPDTAANAGYAKDVVGAADIAAAVAGYATTDVTVGGGTTVSVSGGADITTTNTKIYLGDNVGKDGLKSTVTSQYLPELLASGTFSDDTGEEYQYDQYINLAGGDAYNVVTFGDSNADGLVPGGASGDPALYINLSTSSAQPIYNLTVVFNKVLNITDENVRGNTITIFGKTYTVGSQSSTYSSPMKLELFGGADTQTLSEGDSAEVTIEGSTHTVSLIGVSDTTTAVISVDGQTKEVHQGISYRIANVDVYIDSVYFFMKEGQVSQVKLSLGSSKVVLESGAAVKVGQSEETIDGTLVALTGSQAQGLSKIEIAVGATASDEDWITPEVPFEDPVFGGFKVAFGGLTRGTTETLIIDNSGNTGATVKFTDSRNNEKTLNWIYTQTSAFNPQLNHSTDYAYVVKEGDTVKKNDYVLLAPAQESEFGHIMQYRSASSIGNSNAYIELQDVMSGQNTKIYLTDAGYASGTFYLDGNEYHVKNISSTAQTFQFTWGSGSSAGDDGDKVMVFPLIQTQNGAYMTFIKSLALANDTYELPGNTAALIGSSNTTQAAGRLTYTFAGGGGATNTLTNITGMELESAPAILLYEEKGKDPSDTEVQDAVLATVSQSGTVPNAKVSIASPTLTAVVQLQDPQETDPSVTEYYDRYGTYIKWDSDNEGYMEIQYPDDQSVAMVGIGASPSFGTAAGGSTVQSATMIKNPVAKLDTEVQSLVSAGTLNADVILVGGPCANKVTAEVMDIPNTKPDCYEQFTWTKLIKEYEDALVTGKKALVVAGATADDTRAAAAEVMKGTTSLEVAA